FPETRTVCSSRNARRSPAASVKVRRKKKPKKNPGSYSRVLGGSRRAWTGADHCHPGSGRSCLMPRCPRGRQTTDDGQRTNDKSLIPPLVLLPIDDPVMDLLARQL